VQTSFDKVISYDAQSLLSSAEQDIENNGRAYNKSRARKRSSRKDSRPGTTPLSPVEDVSVNHEFNQKLRAYGTENGVPQSELPGAGPSSVGSRNMKEKMVSSAQ